MTRTVSSPRKSRVISVIPLELLTLRVESAVSVQWPRELGPLRQLFLLNTFLSHGISPMAFLFLREKMHRDKICCRKVIQVTFSTVSKSLDLA